MQLNVSHEIERGDTIEVTLPGFGAPNTASVKFQGRSAGLFSGAWSQGDYALPLNVSSGAVLLPSGSQIARSTTHPSQPLNLTLPSKVTHISVESMSSLPYDSAHERKPNLISPETAKMDWLAGVSAMLQ